MPLTKEEEEGIQWQLNQGTLKLDSFPKEEIDQILHLDCGLKRPPFLVASQLGFLSIVEDCFRLLVSLFFRLLTFLAIFSLLLLFNVLNI